MSPPRSTNIFAPPLRTPRKDTRRKYSLSRHGVHQPLTSRLHLPQQENHEKEEPEVSRRADDVIACAGDKTRSNAAWRGGEPHAGARKASERWGGDDGGLGRAAVERGASWEASSKRRENSEKG
ncbi:hypothetical protein B0H14DRAFT_3458099 [Mycena olivaceomarginata]|nr:hypothetical protein B0H14DRAFT_3458099 [Mycena olivaceomarginata]